MKSSRSLTSVNLLWLSAVICLLIANVLQATPYASSLTNSGSSISFRLNESADNVHIVSNGGATTNQLGARSAGLHTFPLSIGGPFQVVVRKSSGLGWIDGVALKISDDAANETKFFAPRGVAVNTRPGSPYFGRVYVANALAGTASGRSTGDGFYALYSDLSDALGQGDTALTGGLVWDDELNANGDKPWKVELGPDDSLYIGDRTPNSGSLLVVDPDVSPFSGINVLVGFGNAGGVSPSVNHGRIAGSVFARGSLAGGDLVVIAQDGDNAPINGVHSWSIGSGPLPVDVAPISLADNPLLEIAGVSVDLEIGPDGKFYLLQFRAIANSGGLFIADPAVDLTGGGEFGDEANGQADVIFDSLGETYLITGSFDTNDFLWQCRSLKLSADGQYLAIGRHDGPFYALKLTDGLPNLSDPAATKFVATGGGRSLDICFDAAGNIYTVDNIQERLRVWSPGLNSVAVTSSEGTFNVTHVAPTVTTVEVVPADTNIYERIAGDTARVVFNRIGSTANPLTINFSVGGTAAAGVDYSAIGTSVVIPGGESSTSLTINAIDNALLDGNRSIQLALASGSYAISTDKHTVAVIITDDELAPETVLFSDDFEGDTSGLWDIVGDPDHAAIFNYDYTLDGVPSAPRSAGGTTHGLKLRANKEDATGAVAAANAYAKAMNFSGNFALRFDVFCSVGTDAAGTTEHTLCGINHGGTVLNRHAVAGDGIWCAVDNDGTSNRGFSLYANGATAPTLVRGNTDFFHVFTAPPWGFNGAPANTTNSTSGAASGKLWADGEITQIAGVITYKLNNTVILTYTNSSGPVSGTIMVGHNDQFASVGSQNSFSIFDNVRVIALAAPTVITIERITVSGNAVTIDFRADAGDAPGAFTLHRSTVVSSGYAPDAGAVFSERQPPGLFRVTTTTAGATQFYLIEK